MFLDLVFDLEMQLCNWKWDVPEPCGTYIPPTLPPSEEVTTDDGITVSVADEVL